MTAFTPGPWEFRAPMIHAVGGGERVGRIAQVSISYKDTTTFDANAHLIAAAPELYEALTRINATGDVALDIDWIRRISRAALAKARGETA
jgi:hypothetical protein